MKEIEPISTNQFTTVLTTKSSTDKVDYEAYFKPFIEQAKNFAIGPFCWFIPDATVMVIVAASENMNLLTPYTKEEWVGKDPSFLAANIHPDDCIYVLSAIAKTAQIKENLSEYSSNDVRINIYCRMLDANRNYRLTLIQFPASYHNEEGRVESNLFMMTDVSHLQTTGQVIFPMMTLIDYANNISQHYKLTTDATQMLSIDLPRITKRELEILHLMAKGMTTPDIVNALNISYHTVENHKRNLRAKTKTKTSVELINFIWSNNLF
jgi:DNA-binding CsgD family transcriptional regulator